MIQRFKNNFAAAKESEQGDIVQTLLIVVLFVGIVIAVGALLWRAIQGKAQDVSDCITSVKPVAGDHNCS